MTKEKNPFEEFTNVCINIVKICIVICKNIYKVLTATLNKHNERNKKNEQEKYFEATYGRSISDRMRIEKLKKELDKKRKYDTDYFRDNL